MHKSTHKHEEKNACAARRKANRDKCEETASIKQVLLSQTNLLLTETLKLTLKHIKTYLLENGHSVPLSVCQLFDFFSPTTWNLFSTVSFPIYLGFFLTHNCKFIFFWWIFFLKKQFESSMSHFLFEAMGLNCLLLQKKVHFVFLFCQMIFFFLNRHISDISGTCFRFFLFSWWTWKSSNIFFLTSKRFFFTN